MAGRERGLFRMIFKAFIDSLTPNNRKAVLVGEDYWGTKYFEVPRIKSIHNKPNRYFVPVNKKDFEQELPAEWEAWLRGRRRVPPTKEEVMANYKLIMEKKENAATLEASYAEKREIVITDPDAKPLDQHSSLNFPVYDEYKHQGRNYELKIKKEPKI